MVFRIQVCLEENSLKRTINNDDHYFFRLNPCFILSQPGYNPRTSEKIFSQYTSLQFRQYSKRPSIWDAEVFSRRVLATASWQALRTSKGFNTRILRFSSLIKTRKQTMRG